uniref:Uncharacterized protein n=1 Tax=Acrobeloides nanus TaxID=290746 RepID=A0A914CFD6_9BILA
MKLDFGETSFSISSSLDQNFQANIGDDTCHKPYNKYTIGGIFQKCRVIYANETIGDVQYRCDNYRQINENTGDYSCNMGLRAIKLLDVEVNLPIRTERRSYQECSGYLFWKTCKTFEYDIHFQDNALIETYICQAEDPRIAHKEKFYNFGGIYEQNYTNPEEPCPGRFNKYTLFNNTICLSKVSDSRFSMEFGGFFTCQTEEEDARCPVGLTQNLATVMDGCNVYYCSKQNENKVLDEIRWKINRFESHLRRFDFWADITYVTT